MATESSHPPAAPQPVQQPSHRGTDNAAATNTAQSSTSPPTKRELASWWKKFRKTAEKEEEKVPVTTGIFGVPLAESIRYANVAISLTNEQGASFIYGYVPIVVAKCGVFLKEKATDVEGIFRLSGSAKRIKDLQTLFDSPDRYGKGLDWTGYTVHDAANIFRRYLNNLPEPIVPLDFYERFRDPVRSHQAQAVGDMDGQDKDVGNFDHEGAVATFQKLITELPPLNRQLLLYILDLLAVFASKSDMNRMNSANLAAIFQPGIISHPNHDMSPNQYRLSQDVLIFLIENQDNFLFGMSGTGVDEKTVKDMQNGARPKSSPKVPLGRSASNASAGADSLRKLTRRNSVSSRHSKGSTGPAPSPGTPTTPLASTGSSGGVQRSNTVPTKKSPGLASNRFQRSGEPTTPKASATTPPSLQPTSQTQASTVDGPPKDTGSNLAVETKELSGKKPSLQTLPSNLVVPPTTMRSPTRERKISNFFARSPILAPRESDNEQKDGRQPNKLRKKQRIPGSANESAQSSQNSLQGDFSGHQTFHTPLASPDISNHSRLDPLAAVVAAEAPSSTTRHPAPGPVSGGENQEPASQNLKAPRSPEASVRSGSSFSDFDGTEDPSQRGKSRRHRWHFPSSGKKNGNGAPPLAPPPPIGQNGGARGSNSSLGSSSRQRKSFTAESHQTQHTGTDTSSGHPNLSQRKSEESSELLKDSGSEPEKRGLFGKWKAKIAQSKEDKREREAGKERAKSPGHVEGEHGGTKHGLAAMANEYLPHRGRSMEQQREPVLPSVSEAPPSIDTAEADTGSLMSPIPPTPVTAIRVPPETSSQVKEETPVAAAAVPETATPAVEIKEQVAGSVPTTQPDVPTTSPGC